MGASKLLHRILKFINYANLCKFKINKKCYFSISWAILILFVLSDRAWWGLQNFYTEFWNSLVMQIYANLFKINAKCYFSISQRILILFVLSDRAWWGLRNFYTELWNSLIMQIYSKSMKNATSPLFRNRNRSALPAGTYITHRVSRAANHRNCYEFQTALRNYECVLNNYEFERE